MNNLWIKTDDLLPPLNTEVLAHRDGKIDIGVRYERGYKFAGTSTGDDRFKFSHYMPLPPPPACEHEWPELDGQTDMDGACTKCGMAFITYVHMECP